MSKKRRLSNSTYKDHINDKDKGGASRQGIIDWKKCSEKDIKFYDPKNGTNYINIIPFEIKSKLNPRVKAEKAKIGELDYMLDVWVHRYVGPSEVDVLCPKKTYGKPCPICEMVSKYYDEGKKNEAKDIQASRRAFFNVQPIVDDETQPQKVFEVSHWLFAKELLDEANACINGEDVIRFAEIEDGKVIRFRKSEEELGKRKVPKFKSFNFQKREEEISDEMIDAAISFDAGLVLHSYEDIERIFYGQDEDETSDKSDKEETKEKPVEKEKKEKDEPTESEKAIEDEPIEKSKDDGKCPAGHEWGGADSHKECDDDCPLWEECFEAGKGK